MRRRCYLHPRRGAVENGLFCRFDCCGIELHRSERFQKNQRGFYHYTGAVLSTQTSEPAGFASFFYNHFVPRGKTCERAEGLILKAKYSSPPKVRVCSDAIASKAKFAPANET
jgi:hypothetical protein